MSSSHGCSSEASTYLLALIISVSRGSQRLAMLPRVSVCGGLGPPL